MVETHYQLHLLHKRVGYDFVLLESLKETMTFVTLEELRRALDRFRDEGSIRRWQIVQVVTTVLENGDRP